MILRTFLLTCFIAFVSTARAGETKLRLNLEKGETYRIKSTTDQKIFRDASLSNKLMDGKTEMYMSYKVVDKSEDGVHKLRFSIDRVVLNQNMSGMSISYDSDEPSDSTSPMAAQIAQTYAPLLDTSAVYSFDAQGKIINNDESSESGSAMASTTSLQKLASRGMMELPQKEIEENSTWNKDMNLATQTDSAQSAKITVTEIDGDQVKLKIDMDLSDLNISSKMAQKPEIEAGGNAVINSETGWAEKSSMNMSMKGESPQMGQFYLVMKIDRTTL